MKKLFISLSLVLALGFLSCSSDIEQPKQELIVLKKGDSLTPKQIEEIEKITIAYASKGVQRDGIKCSTKKGSKAGGIVLEYSGYILAAEWFTDSLGQIQVKLITEIDSNMVNWHCNKYNKM